MVDLNFLPRSRIRGNVTPSPSVEDTPEGLGLSNPKALVCVCVLAGLLLLSVCKHYA